MKHLYLVAILLVLSCSSKQTKEVVDYNQVDSIINSSQNTIVKNDSIHKESEKVITKTVQQVVSEIQTLKEEAKIAKGKTTVLTITKIDTVYIEKKKNFWGKEKTAVTVKSDSSAVEDSTQFEYK